VLPRSGRANPSLTIFAWALRVGDLLLKQTRGETHESVHEEVAA
jgi:choline dehydrogenase-like flavoprotein